MYRALAILNVCAGDNHPDLAAIYLNLALMYQDIENHHAAIDCFSQALHRNIDLYGEKHM